MVASEARQKVKTVERADGLRESGVVIMRLESFVEACRRMTFDLSDHQWHHSSKIYVRQKTPAG